MHWTSLAASYHDHELKTPLPEIFCCLHVQCMEQLQRKFWLRMPDHAHEGCILYRQSILLPSNKIPIQPVVVSVWSTKQSALLVQGRAAKTPLTIGSDGPTTQSTIPYMTSAKHCRLMTCMQLAIVHAL